MSNSNYLHIINPIIATIIGQNESILLNQLEYWISKCGRNIDNLDGKWIYNSYKKWSEQFTYWSTSKLRRTIRSLENLGLIKSAKVNSKKWDQTKWYSINYNEYNKLLGIKNSISSNTSNTYNNVHISNLPSNIDLTNDQLKSKISSVLIRSQKNHQINKNAKSTKIISIIRKITQKSPKVCICSKWTNQSVYNEQMLIITKNNYTNKSSYKKTNVELENALKEKIEENCIKPNEKEIISKMLYIWNKVFEYSISPIKAYSNKKNQEVLLNLYKTAFSGDLNNWREYACKVNSSQFLMGEKKTKNNFKAVFSWLIKEETIEKILNGEYGVGDRELDMNNVTKNIEEKKEEVVNKMDKKISEYIKHKIDETKERREFEEYVKVNQAERKEDEYGILKAIRHISYHSIFRTNGYEVLRESLYESYIMKKYCGLTKMEARNKIREKAREIDEITNHIDKINMLREIEEKIENKEYMINNSWKNQEKRNYNSELLESTFCSKPKKESRYLKVSSGESSIRDLLI
jgi:hypothetical protein